MPNHRKSKTFKSPNKPKNINVEELEASQQEAESVSYVPMVVIDAEETKKFKVIDKTNSKATPKETPKSEATSSKATPSKAIPSKAILSKAILSKTTPSKVAL